MSRRFPGYRWQHWTLAVSAFWLTVLAAPASAQELLTLPPLTAKVASPALSRQDVVRWALENNPELAALRQQRGIAAAGVVIARTYPFNPILEGRVEGAAGPAGAGITNSVLNEYKILMEVELRGQRNFRSQVATAALTRTEWEIAYLEILFAARVLRAFDGVLYRHEKLRLVDERIRLNEKAAKDIFTLRKQGKLSPADPFLIQTEIDDAKAQRGAAELALTVAEYDLRRATGVLGETLVLDGSMEEKIPAIDLGALTALALDRRPDLRARQAAVAEAEGRLRLENSNRFGNPSIGPSYELDTARVSTLGVSMIVPLPVFNVHRGDILQRQAEQARAVLELRQVEVLVQQDVQAALARAQRAQTWAQTYDKQVLPNLRKNLAAVEKLFLGGEAGVDVIRVLEIRRNLLKGQDSYVDALWEWAQAKADLIAAVGDLGLVLEPQMLPRLPPLP